MVGIDKLFNSKLATTLFIIINNIYYTNNFNQPYIILWIFILWILQREETEHVMNHVINVSTVEVLVIFL